MNSSPQSPSLTAPPAGQADYGSLRSFIDEDMALGCECADPALQIDGWHEEAPKPMHKPY
jgi:hypothetical protein